MKALLYQGPRNIVCESFDDPKLADERDAIVKMTRCGICGSDLHIYHGQGFSPDLGFCVGHEAVGEVVEVGRGVKQLKVGQSVMLSAAVGCGACGPCLAGNVNQCRNGMAGCYGLSHRLEGCQAEYIRVPAADFNAAAIPEGLSEDQALMLTDNLPTAWFGLKAVEGAFVLGASQVFAIDLVPERRAIAASLGAVALGPDEAGAVIAER